MPKRVDHDERRREIGDAVIRIATKRGLDAATFRGVAAEAGVSVRLVQYYFGAKDDLLQWTQRYVATRSKERFVRRLQQVNSRDPRTVLRTVLGSFIPTDEESREAMWMFVVLHTAALVDPTLTRSEAREVPLALQSLVLAELKRARLPEGVRAELEAAALTAMTASLAQTVLDGMSTPDDALEVLNYAIDRAFGKGGGDGT